MMTVKEVCHLTGVSARTLHYYDEIGLLCPAEITQAGYRLYDNESLERLEQILLFRELGFPLKDIQKIVSDKQFDRQKALSQQIELLTLQKEHIEKLIAYAKHLKMGGNNMNFDVFDKTKMEEYEQKAKEAWGHTDAYVEYTEKTKNNSTEDITKNGMDLMELFVQFGSMKDKSPKDESVQSQVQILKDFITNHYYTCTNPILKGLGELYVAGDEMTENIDKAGGKGTATFVKAAIDIFCG